MAPLDAMVSFESASVPQENLEVKEALKTVKVRFSFLQFILLDRLESSLTADLALSGILKFWLTPCMVWRAQLDWLSGITLTKSAPPPANPIEEKLRDQSEKAERLEREAAATLDVKRNGEFTRAQIHMDAYTSSDQLTIPDTKRSFKFVLAELVNLFTLRLRESVVAQKDLLKPLAGYPVFEKKSGVLTEQVEDCAF